MNSKVFKILHLAAGLAGCVLAAAPDRVPGRLLVGYRRAADFADPAAGRVLLAHRAAVRRRVDTLGVAAVDVPGQSGDAVAASLRATGLFDFVEPDYYGHTAADPNDPSYIAQWHLRRVSTPLAWTLTTGSASVVVAVVDSGVFAAHPDLASKLVPGRNFIRQNDDTGDVLGHGTAVAGTVAAATNNGIGVAGVNWASRIMPLVAVDEHDYAPYSAIAEAIQYAADHGARVINVSIGGRNASGALQRAVDYAWSKGAMVFASAMNESTNQPYYPAACTNAVSISATDAGDRLATFSNYGSWITFAAPGAGILSTADGGGYGYWNGTSFASPIAAGVAALLFAVNPALTNAEALAILKKTADLPAGLQAPDLYFGWGRINAYRAVLAAKPPLDRSERGVGVPRKRR